MSATIEVRDLVLDFPNVRFRARGLKESFVEWTRLRRHSQPHFRALDGVSFRITQGEVVGIVGRNGSGKSTLLRVIAGIYAADGGEVRTRGRISSLLELGAGFRDELTGLENISLAGAIMGFSGPQMRSLTPDIVDFSELGEFIDAPLRTYSSGMRSRLGFAVAAAMDPDILLIDEALAVGDARFRERSMARIEAMVAAEHTTVVVVSHNANELRRLCSRLVLLERGKKIIEGEPEMVLARYRELIQATP